MTAQLVALDRRSVENAKLDRLPDPDLVHNESEPRKRIPALQLERFGDRFGRAGFVTPDHRDRLRLTLTLLCGLITLLGAILGARWSPLCGVIGTLGGLVFSGAGILIFLCVCEGEETRRVVFVLPLFLESIVLLVESGLGILPALERVVQARTKKGSADTVTQLFRAAYQLSANGIPLEEALESVSSCTPHQPVKHVMLHLDITGREGGELIPSLRSLSDHAQNQWRLSVERRVKRLENFVVFPVFTSVLGLMALTVAVPIVPLLSLKESLEKQPRFVSESNGGANNEIANSITGGAQP
ncbi:MAG: type II secretion system F family protein [Bdellovibrionota bacterium]